MTTKMILLLLTWPPGIALTMVVIREGMRLESFALAVHEMLAVLLVLGLMILAATFSVPTEKGLWRAVRHVLWFAAIAAPSAILNYVFLSMLTGHFVFDDISTATIVAASVSGSLLLVGLVTSFYKVVK